jgi:hypothetical protein
MTHPSTTMTRYYSFIAYVLSSFFSKKVSNAIGIANLPQALRTLDDARRLAKEVKDTPWSVRLAYAWAVIQSLVVFSGLTNRWTSLIQINTVAFTLNALRDTCIVLYHQSLEKTMKHDNVTASKNKDDLVTKPVQTPEQRVKEMIQTLHSNRAYEDFAWGAFQCALLYFNLGRAKALGYAGFAFLLSALEKAFLNEKLTWKQRFIQFGVLCLLGYWTGRLAF